PLFRSVDDVSSPETPPITIRPASARDALALTRLAALDSAPIPPAPVLLVEVDGELRAAVSGQDLTAVADPFRQTAGLVALARDHIARSVDAGLPPTRGRTTAALRGARLRVVFQPVKPTPIDAR